VGGESATTVEGKAKAVAKRRNLVEALKNITVRGLSEAKVSKSCKKLRKPCRHAILRDGTDFRR